MKEMTDGGFSIRPALPEDAERITAIEKEVFSCPWDVSAVADTLASPLSSSTVLLTEDGILAGYCLSTLIPPEGEILRIAVLPSFRRRGFAAALVAHTKGDELYLEVRAKNMPAIALYRACGFIEIGRRKNYYRDPPDDAILMRRTRKETDRS